MFNSPSRNHRPVILPGLCATLLLISLPGHSQDDDDPFALEGVQEVESAEQPEVADEIIMGLYHLDDPSFRFGKFSGLSDDGAELILDFSLDRRPQWNGEDLTRWSLEGRNLGLDSRRLAFDWSEQGKQSFEVEFRQFPNNRFNDGWTPYRGVGSGNLTLPSSWDILPGSSNTRGFITLDQSLQGLSVDSERRRLEANWSRKISRNWSFDLEYRHETEVGLRTIGAIFGSSGGNPRGVMAPAPIDHSTEVFEGMFRFANGRAQFGLGFYTSYFYNDQPSLSWENAYGRQSQWAESVSFTEGARGRLALEPDNSFVQLKGYAGLTFGAGTQLNVDFSHGSMKQDDPFLPYTVNPNLVVDHPLPLLALDGKIDTTTFTARFTSRLAPRLNLALNYRYDDRDNQTPREVYPYIGGDSQDQRGFEDGRINLPYGYREEKLDLSLAWRVARGVRIRAGLGMNDYSRTFSEVSSADEDEYFVSLRLSRWEYASLSLMLRSEERDVSEYRDNLPFLASHLQGTHEEDEWENHFLIRKYYLTDRDRDELRFRADFTPDSRLNFGVSMSEFEDEYDDQFFGLNESEVSTWGFDFGFYPVDGVTISGFYSSEDYDSEQSNRSFRGNSPEQAFDPARNWFANTKDVVDTYNLSFAFESMGARENIDFGFDYTYSNTRSLISVTAPVLSTAPLPPLRSRWENLGIWGQFSINENSKLRLGIEKNELRTDDFGLDEVLPDTLSNVLLTAESAANYDLLLVSAAWIYRF